MPQLSVIVPVYNVERYLDRCLSSIEAQPVCDMEIICVNDGSTDSSPEILRAHAMRDVRLRIVDKPNGGYGHTINRGIVEATGDYIGIVESDDFVEPDMFPRMLERARRDDTDIVRANYWLYWSAPRERDELVDLCREELCDGAFDPRERVDAFFFPPALWSMLVRHDLIVENGLRLLETPGASFQDTSFSFKLWACARKAVLLHEPVLHYRQDNEGSSINSRDKAYFVCEEYAEIERFVCEDAADRSLMPLAQKRKYDAYTWNLRRIDPSLRLDFARRASEEFSDALHRGWMDPLLLSTSQRRALRVLTKSPETFVSRVNAGASPGYPVFLSRLFGCARG